MVKTIKLNANLREEKGKAGRKVRHTGFVPAVLYGPGEKNVNLKIKEQEINKIFAHHDTSGLIDLSIDGAAPIATIIKDEQRQGLSDKLLHLDFYKVNMKNKIDVEIPLHFINEAKAVKELGGTLIKNFETLEVKCLPGDLLDKIDVDLSVLNTFDDTIKISDLHLSADFEITKHLEDVVAHVMEPKLQVEEEVTVAADATAEATADEKEDVKKEEGKREEKK
jgi:large subunit ribosomal protein L25